MKDDSESAFKIYEASREYLDVSGTRVSGDEALLQLVALERGDVLHLAKCCTAWTITRTAEQYHASAWVNVGDGEGIKLQFETSDSPDPREILRFVEEQSR